MNVSDQSRVLSTGSKPPIKFVRSQASLLLDLIRALAAFIVLSEHWRNIFFLDFPQLFRRKTVCFVPYLLVSAGHQAVIIFFVLSGYLISGSVFRMFQREQWSWRTYLLHRFLRLWIVLAPGLILTAAADRIGMTLRSPSAIALYSGLSGDHVVGPVRSEAGALTGLGNFLFLQGIKVDSFGSNGALWSLANEFWYYLLFPLAFIALRRKTRLDIRLLNASLFVLAAWFVRENILAGFPTWLLGTLLATLPAARVGARVRWIASVLYAILFYAFARAPQLQGRWSDYALGVATFAFLWVVLSASRATSERSLPVRATRLFARSSYTLYVVHTPLLALIAALTLGSERWQPDVPHVAAGVAILTLVAGLCLLLATQTELRTDAIRTAIERLVESSDSTRRSYL